MGIKRLIRGGINCALSPILTAQRHQLEDLKLLHGKNLVHQVKTNGVYGNIHDAEFKVFSQFGDDGIIQYLVNGVDIPNKTFIEFGVGNYTESNTRFLVLNDNWTGLVMDGSEKNIKYIKQDAIHWRHDLTAVCAFVDRENINQLFRNNGFAGEIGLLSIDIDGNDYWIWDAIEVVDPATVIVEYNSHFGCRHAVTVPYDAQFDRAITHFSYQFWGASLKALYLLAERKGYQFVGCCSGGNNAYFVKKGRLGVVKPLTVEEGYVESKFRDSRDRQGKLSFLSGADRLKVIAEMPVYHVELDRIVQIQELDEVKF